MKKLLALLIFASAMFIFYTYFKKSISYNYKEPNIEQLVKAKSQDNYLDKEIVAAIKAKKFDDAKVYEDLAKEFNITLLPQTKELIAKENTTAKKIKRGAKNFFNGFISGKANNGVEVAGAVASDFTIYGDLRDITVEGKKYIDDKPYDKLILGLSMAGLALSASQFVTLGSSSTLKVGASTLKVAKREKLLSKNFTKILSERVGKTVDFKALKRVKLGSISELKRSSKIIKNSVHLAPIKPIFKNLKTIEKSTSISDTIHLMKYVDNTKDLKNIAKLSKRYKGATRGLLKIFGKNIFRLVKVGVKWTTPLIISVAGFILSAFGFIYTLFSILFGKRK